MSRLKNWVNEFKTYFAKRKLEINQPKRQILVEEEKNQNEDAEPSTVLQGNQ